jgi:hypothetical protein
MSHLFDLETLLVDGSFFSTNCKSIGLKSIHLNQIDLLSRNEELFLFFRKR